MSGNGKAARSALLIRCTAEEAAAIRNAAKLERRTVSAYVLRAVMNRMSVHRRLDPGINPQGEAKRDRGQQAASSAAGDEAGQKQGASGLQSAL